jgi:hypothetical protein
MIPRISGLTLLYFAVCLLVACSKPESKNILGHWRAERVAIQSLRLPLGPEFVIDANSIRATDGSVEIPISGISTEGDIATLEGPLGVGFDFRFEGSDRISFDIPLAGRVYFERVKNSPTTNRNAISAPQRKQEQMPSAPAFNASAKSKGSKTLNVLLEQAHQALAANAFAETEALLTQARSLNKNEPLVDFNFAILRMRQEAPDAAVRSLRDAFEHGFRDFPLLESSADLAKLKADPRYQALITRYH